jgi:hypothetical protein
MRLSAIFCVIILGCLATSAAGRPAKRVVIIAKPKFQHEAQFVDLVISDSHQSLEIG